MRVGNASEDPFNVVAKTDVEHPVSFVQNDVVNLVQNKGATLEQIHHPARGSHHNVHTTFE